MAQAPVQQFDPSSDFKGRRWKMTFEEFIEWDGDGIEPLRVEWVNGEAVELPYITIRHNLLTGFLITLLGFLTSVRGLGQVLFEPFTMRAEPNGNGRCPDVFLVRSEHCERIKERFLEGPADLVIEVASDSSIREDYIIKLAEYRRAGVPEYWIIDPIGRTATFMVLDQNGEYRDILPDAQGNFASPALNGIQINIHWFEEEELPNPLNIAKQWGLL